MTFGEFQHRFSILAPPEIRQSQPVLDEKKVGTLSALLGVAPRCHTVANRIPCTPPQILHPSTSSQRLRGARTPSLCSIY
jgi:hypothetical protein